MACLREGSREKSWTEVLHHLKALRLYSYGLRSSGEVLVSSVRNDCLLTARMEYSRNNSQEMHGCSVVPGRQTADESNRDPNIYSFYFL